MTTNSTLRYFGYAPEQEVLEDLIIESIQNHGIDTYYVPMTQNAYDKVYGEDTQKSYETAFPIEMYLESFEGFQGDGTFMSAMGVEVRDQVVFSVARRRFNEEVEGASIERDRPFEGDLVYYPFNNKLFEIKFVDKFEMHYPLGTLYLWQLKLELMEYVGQTFSTGVTEIDDLGTAMATAMENNTEEGGDFDNEEIQEGADEIVDHTILDIYSEKAW